MKDSRRFQSSILNWFSRESRDLPWRQTSDPYLIWLSEVMCQQTGVKTVIPYFLRFLNEFPRVEDLAAAEESKVIRMWEGLGYYSRARNLHRAARFIVAEFQGKFPQNLEEIRKLPGVGEYTAGAILSIAFRNPQPALDGNLIRVYSRFFALEDLVDSLEGKKKLWNLARQMTVTEPSESRAFTEGMMELGALVCRPKNPQCFVCPIKWGCKAFKLNQVLEYPRKKKSAQRIKRYEKIFLHQQGQKILILQKGSDPKYPHFWRLPFQEVKEIPKRFSEKEKYSITNRDYEVFIFRKKQKLRQAFSGKFYSLAKLEELSFPAIDRRILKRIMSESV